MGLPLEKLPDWPAGLNRQGALDYSGVSEAQLREWQKRGQVRFLPRGPNGAMLCMRSDVDAALREMFINGSPEDLEF
jgi:predicted site-specific integrase-resolvase